MAKEGRRFWLVKSEPGAYSIEDLERDGKTGWDGVRNFQARNFLRDVMQKGDGVLFYHSGANPPGVAGVAKVIGAPRPDKTQFKVGHEHFDGRSKPDAPSWFERDIAFVERFPRFVAIAELRANPALEGLSVLARGQRLSVMPVEPRHFDEVVRMGRGMR